MTVDRTLMIEDWALGALYWNCLSKTLDEMHGFFELLPFLFAPGCTKV